MSFGFGSNNRERLDRIGAVPENNRIESERLKTNSEWVPSRRTESGRTSARILSLISVALFALALGLYLRLPDFRVASVQIYGHENVNPEELIYYTGMKNRAIGTVDPEVIERNIFRRYPENRAISVHAALPNRLDVYFEQRVAVVEWNFGGSRFWIDEEGFVFNENLSASPEIIVYANSFPGAMNRNDRTVPKKFRKDIVDSVRRIFAVKPTESRLNFTYDNGYGWDSGKGYMLWIGVNDSGLNEKMAMADGLDRYFKANELEPEMLSLEFINAPYYRFAD